MSMKQFLGKVPYFNLKLSPLPREVTTKKVIEALTAVVPMDRVGYIDRSDPNAAIIPVSEEKLYDQALRARAVQIEDNWVLYNH